MRYIVPAPAPHPHYVSTHLSPSSAQPLPAGVTLVASSRNPTFPIPPRAWTYTTNNIPSTPADVPGRLGRFYRVLVSNASRHDTPPRISCFHQRPSRPPLPPTYRRALHRRTQGLRRAFLFATAPTFAVQTSSAQFCPRRLAALLSPTTSTSLMCSDRGGRSLSHATRSSPPRARQEHYLRRSTWTHSQDHTRRHRRAQRRRQPRSSPPRSPPSTILPLLREARTALPTCTPQNAQRLRLKPLPPRIRPPTRREPSPPPPHPLGDHDTHPARLVRRVGPPACAARPARQPRLRAGHGQHGGDMQPLRA
ncbi:hypothetical protein C8J57DRAFT_715937 [Mycena rebaudengoi]|nr:hypothetical protein C8J57DRAFT_715937 [Mycena rebaudengoi]